MVRFELLSGTGDPKAAGDLCQHCIDAAFAQETCFYNGLSPTRRLTGGYVGPHTDQDKVRTGGRAEDVPSLPTQRFHRQTGHGLHRGMFFLENPLNFVNRPVVCGCQEQGSTYLAVRNKE